MHNHTAHAHQKRNGLGTSVSIVLCCAIILISATIVFLVWRKPSAQSDNSGTDVISGEPAPEVLAESEESVPEPEQTPEETALQVETDEEETLQTESASSDMDPVPESSGSAEIAEECTITGHINKERDAEQSYSCALSVPTFYDGSTVCRIYLEETAAVSLGDYTGKAVCLTGECYYDEETHHIIMSVASLSMAEDGMFPVWEKTDWKKAYTAKLGDFPACCSCSSYIVYDIQMDGTPELFVDVSWDATYADYSVLGPADMTYINVPRSGTYAVYGIADSGQVELIDSIDCFGDCAYLCGTNSSNCLLFSYVRMNGQVIKKLYLTYGRFKPVFVYSGFYDLESTGNGEVSYNGLCELESLELYALSDSTGLNRVSGSGKDNLAALMKAVKDKHGELTGFTGNTYIRENYSESKALADAMADCWYGGYEYSYIGTTDNLLGWESLLESINCHSLDVYLVENNFYLYVPYIEGEDYIPLVLYGYGDENMEYFWYVSDYYLWYF